MSPGQLQRRVWLLPVPVVPQAMRATEELLAEPHGIVDAQRSIRVPVCIRIRRVARGRKLWIQRPHLDVDLYRITDLHPVRGHVSRIVEPGQVKPECFQAQRSTNRDGRLVGGFPRLEIFELERPPCRAGADYKTGVTLLQSLQ